MLGNMKNIEKIGEMVDFLVDMVYHFQDVRLKGFLCHNNQLIMLIERCK